MNSALQHRPKFTEIRRKVSRKESAVLGFSVAELSNLKIGGVAPLALFPRDEQELVEHLLILRESGLRFVLVGHGSNLFFCDDALEVPVISLRDFSRTLQVDGDRVIVGSGAWVPNVATALGRRGLSGLEHICGIPGSFGGLICMNGGSQRKSVAEHVRSVRAVDYEGNQVEFGADECSFSYRKSRFLAEQWIITSVKLGGFKTVSYDQTRPVIREILASRRRKFPRKLPNCGSIFVGGEELFKSHGPPGAIIESLGLKGLRCGGALVSTLHANFIVNEGAAKCADVLWLIKTIRERAKSVYGVDLRTEVRCVTPKGSISPADVLADSGGAGSLEHLP